jgi:hypothetical protein
MKYAKVKKRLDRRIAGYYKSIEHMSAEEAAGYHCPGSNKK